MTEIENTENALIEKTRQLLVTKCEECYGLCCVALFCAKTDGFPQDKVAGEPCLFLQDDHKCEIHAQLLEKKFKGCLAFDCAGAGNHVVNMHKSIKLKNDIDNEKGYIDFLNFLKIHQTLFYLMQAYEELKERKLKRHVYKMIENFHMNMYANIEANEIETLQGNANTLLKQISTYICEKHGKNMQKKKDFIAHSFKQKEIEGMDLTMSYCIAADFKTLILNKTNFLGADLRDANICGANLSQALFLTQMQINACNGDANTILPKHLKRPTSWDIK